MQQIMHIHHVALWTLRLEELKEFYIRYFNGINNEKYVNPKKGFESYFIYFDNGTLLELMTRTDIQNTPIEENRLGLTHLAFTFPSEEEIIRFTELMRAEGHTIASEPRISGDGYFESVILDPDGNRLECIYKITSLKKPIAPLLTTEHLILRPFQTTDVEAIFECCKNPKLGNNAGWMPHLTIKDSEDILQSLFLDNEGTWAITLKENGQLIGSIGLMPDPQRDNNPRAIMIGYWLDEAHWGKGYMSEAVRVVLKRGFNELQANVITATCYPHNKRSANVLTRNGFTYEGTLHQAEIDYKDDTLDLDCYYLTADCYNSI